METMENYLLRNLDKSIKDCEEGIAPNVKVLPKVGH